MRTKVKDISSSNIYMPEKKKVQQDIDKKLKGEISKDGLRFKCYYI